MSGEDVAIGDLAKVNGTQYSRCERDESGVFRSNAPHFERDELVIILGLRESYDQTWAKVFTRLGVYYILAIALVPA